MAGAPTALRRSLHTHDAVAPTRQVMRVSTLDGLFAAQYVTLTSGPLLAVFLLALGASAFEVGLAAALPLLGNLLQPAGAEVVRRLGGRRRPVALAAALADAALWGGSVAAVVWLPPPAALLAVLGVLAVQQVPSAFVGVAWTSWISDLIPIRLRGRYFGRRNVIGGGLAAATAVAAGFLVQGGPDPVPRFLVAVGVGVAARLASVYFLSRHPEPRPARSVGGGAWAQLAPPLRHRVFRRYLAYNAAWGFSVHVAAPFFTVFMVREAGLGAGVVMVQAALSTAANLLGQHVWGPLADRYGERQVLGLAGLVIAFQPLWWLFVGGGLGGVTVALVLVLGAVGGFAWGGQGLASANLMMRLAPEEGKTAFFGVQAALAGFAGALGPLVGGVLAGVVTDGTLGPWVPRTLKVLFVASVACRLVALGLLARVPHPVGRPPLRVVYLLRNTARTFNPAQGFSPLLQAFAAATAPLSSRGRWRRWRAARGRAMRQALRARLLPEDEPKGG
jgi:MFS family permease